MVSRRTHREENQPAAVVTFLPAAQRRGGGPSAGWWRGRSGVAQALAVRATLDGPFLPDPSLRQPFRLPPPHRFATGRMVGAPTVFPTHPSICHIPEWLFENQILLLPICKSGAGRPVAVRCFPFYRSFRLAAPKLNKRLLRA